MRKSRNQTATVAATTTTTPTPTLEAVSNTGSWAERSIRGVKGWEERSARMGKLMRYETSRIAMLLKMIEQISSLTPNRTFSSAGTSAQSAPASTAARIAPSRCVTPGSGRA